MLFVTFNKIRGSQAWQMSLWYLSTSVHIYLVVKRRAKIRKKESEREREEGGVKCWNMNYKPEQHHLDRENTHHSGEPAHWIRLATGSICTSWNQSHSLIWLGRPHRRKRKLLWSLIKLVSFSTSPHPPIFGMLCIPISLWPTGRVMAAVEVNVKKSPSI